MPRIGQTASDACCRECGDDDVTTLDGLCVDCYTGPLAGWMAEALFAIEEARSPSAWRDYLDYWAACREAA